MVTLDIDSIVSSKYTWIKLLSSHIWSQMAISNNIYTSGRHLFQVMSDFSWLYETLLSYLDYSCLKLCMVRSNITHLHQGVKLYLIWYGHAIDGKLPWENHINDLCTSLVKCIGIFYNLRGNSFWNSCKSNLLFFCLF